MMTISFSGKTHGHAALYMLRSAPMTGRLEGSKKVVVKRLFSLCLFVTLGLAGCLQQPAGAPFAPGEVEIHVEYENFSTDHRNQLVRFVRDLPETYNTSEKGADRVKTDSKYHRSYHGFWNDGHVAARYVANHVVPDQDVEADMRALLQEWLIENKLKEESVTLNLRYGENTSSVTDGHESDTDAGR